MLFLPYTILMLNIKTPLKNIPLINAKYQKILEKISLKTIEDFLFYFPFRYDDFSQTAALSPKRIGETITVSGIVIKAKNNRIFRRRMTLQEVLITDENSTPLKITWFNQPFILESLKIGSNIRVSGKLEVRGKYFAMTNPAWERAARDMINTGRLVPVYGETKGLTSKWIRWQMKIILEKTKIEDMLPTDILKKFNLPNLKSALVQIHFPSSQEKLLIAQKRFAFQEMFLVQLKSLQAKSRWEAQNSLKIKFDEKLVQNFVSNLPFKLTDAQRKSAFEILKDLTKSRPMNRLLNGDVGSGKTMVAAIASLEVLKNGYQVAIMTPTEVLAKQHFENFSEIFKNYAFNIALLTNSYKITAGHTKTSRDKLLKEIGQGKTDLIIGTQALIQKDVAFKNLALIVIDEQHRFGVAQRAFLQQGAMQIKDGLKNAIPHLLTMTATPIPRTLAIAFSGNLDISLLDEMPKNRKKIITRIIPPQKRNTAYEFIRQQIKSGRQAFIILPLVEESKILTEIKAAVQEHARLSKEIFPEFNLGLLHGKLKPTEKESVMRDFKNKKTNILVSTSVVEVGIDIPSATVIVIEDADRFGLSQLHQFRGRVGRSEFQSYCFLFTNSDSQKSTARLEALEKSNDGFEVAQKDLELRGPGQFFGTLQSGLPDIAMENLTNIKLIKFARTEAQDILRDSLDLKKHPLLKSTLQKFQEKIHLE